MSQKWTMWEHYETTGSKTETFEDQMAVVCWFNDFVNFAKAWNKIPHKELSNFFYDSESRKVPM
jgi:hypothetical protein